MAGTDVGLFGPGSVTWRIHSDPSSAIGGMRALLLQALDPRAMAAMDQHSSYRTDPWGRLRRTSQYVAVTTFGDTASAHAIAARVRRVHSRIRGWDPVTRRIYRADDPELLLWVHATEVQSFLVAYRSYGGRLNDSDADAYVAEMVRAAELMELDPAAVPSDVATLDRYIAEYDALAVTPAARAGLRVLLAPPLPALARPLWVVPATAAVAILPARARELYGLPYVSLLDPVVRLSVFMLCRALNIALPGSPYEREARARVAAGPAEAIGPAT
jgi:uncharacterized protein (DUF2236 family)